MTTSTLLILALLGVPRHAPATACWKDAGRQAEYGSADQIRDLQQFARSNTSCAFFAITWRIRPLPNRRSLVVWDLDGQRLVRIHIEGGQPRWERWTGVTRRAVIADDPDDGYDYTSYTSGRGPAGLPAAAKRFVRSNARAVFDAGL